MWPLTQAVLGLAEVLVSTVSRFPGEGGLKEESKASTEASTAALQRGTVAKDTNIFSADCEVP